MHVPMDRWISNNLLSIVLLAGVSILVLFVMRELYYLSRLWGHVRFARTLTEGLEQYHTERGEFPVRPEFAPLVGNTREALKAWLPELPENTLQKLPHTFANNDNGFGQWLYRSDGRDFKLIYFHPSPGEAKAASRYCRGWLDPERASLHSVGAYGIWSRGATSW